MNKVDDIILDLGEGQLAERLTEQLEGQMDKVTKQIQAEVFGKLLEGEALDPQFAVQQWVRLFTLSQIQQGINKKIKRGKAASERYGESLTSP